MSSRAASRVGRLPLLLLLLLLACVSVHAEEAQATVEATPPAAAAPAAAAPTAAAPAAATPAAETPAAAPAAPASAPPPESLASSDGAAPVAVSHSLRVPVPKITEAEFEALAHGGMPIFVKFYAPWCGYCVRMHPAFEEAAVQMRSQTAPTQLVQVDCMEERTLCSRFGVAAFPQLRLIRRVDPDDRTQPLRVFHFNMQRSALSFLVFCSTIWRTMLDAAVPYPEPAPQEAQRLRDVWAAQQQTQPPGADAPAAAAAAGSDPPSGSLTQLSPDAKARGSTDLVLPSTLGLQGVAGDLSDGGVAASADSARPSRLPFILGFFAVAFLCGGMLLRHHWTSLRMRVTRHHSLQLSKNY